MSLELAKALHAIGSPRILVVGDVIQDLELECKAERFAQEAGHCPVWREHQWLPQRMGGSGAVANMAEALRAKIRLISALAPHRATKVRYVVNGVQQLRIDADGRQLCQSETDRLASETNEEIQRADCVLIADYGKGVCTDAVLGAAIDGAREMGIPCIVDPAHGMDWRRYDGATRIKCNESEWNAQPKNRVVAMARNPGFEAVARPVSNFQYGAPPNTIVTLGARGLRLGDMPIFARHRRAIDPTGCGDMVLAALGVCIAGGMDWPDACKVANAAAGLKVERRGAVPVSRAEVILDLCHPHKIIPADFLYHVRATDKRIVFTNGVFRVPTAAHAWVLQQAKAHGDILVVGINSDKSAATVKPGEFVLPLVERAAMLESMSAVDWVVPFDGENPNALLEALNPNVLVKGYDQIPEHFPGEIVTIPEAPFGQHVTGLVAEICEVGR